jgi:uncharacterized protein YdeI (YjbR/CyaY-like superfamily)
VQPEGLAAFEKRKDCKSKMYAYENEALELSAEYEKQFNDNKAAWAFFNKQPPWYRRNATYLVMNDKQEKTRIDRLQTLINASETGKKIDALNYGTKKE